MLDRLVTWKKDFSVCIRAAGATAPDQDLRHAMIKMLPGGLSLEMLGKVHANETNFYSGEYTQTSLAQREFFKV